MMLSNPTRIHPSPLLKCSEARPGHINSLRPGLFLGIGFNPRTVFSYSRPHLGNFPKINNTRESISPPNNKPREMDGMATRTPAGEDEGLNEEEKKKVSDCMEGRSEAEKEMFLYLVGRRTDLTNMTAFFVGLLGQDKKKIEMFADGMEEEEFRTKFRDFLNEFNEKEKKTMMKIMMSALDFLPRIGFSKKVFGILAAQLLLGSAGYTTMKMNRTITAAFQQNYFKLFSLLFTGGLFLLPTLNAFKDMSSVGEKNILNSIFLGLFNVAMVSIGAIMVDIHLASSNGLIMVGAFASTFFIFTFLTLFALLTWKMKESSDVGTTLSSSSTSIVILSVITSFIQIVNPGPISAAIDIGFHGSMFCSFVTHDVWMMLNRYKEDDYTKASAHMFLHFYGLLIVSIKALGILSGFFIFSNRVLGMLYALLFSSITTFRN